MGQYQLSEKVIPIPKHFGRSPTPPTPKPVKQAAKDRRRMLSDMALVAACESPDKARETLERFRCKETGTRRAVKFAQSVRCKIAGPNHRRQDLARRRAHRAAEKSLLARMLGL